MELIISYYNYLRTFAVKLIIIFYNYHGSQPAPPPPSDGVHTRARARLRLETPLKECIGDKSMEQETVSRYIYLKRAMD